MFPQPGGWSCMLSLTGASSSIRERYNAFLLIEAEGESNRSPGRCSLPAGYKTLWSKQGQGVQVASAARSPPRHSSTGPRPKSGQQAALDRRSIRQLRRPSDLFRIRASMGLNGAFPQASAGGRRPAL